MFIKNPPRRRFHFSLLFITREAEVITSFYEVTAMEQIDTLTFDAVIKLRNNKEIRKKNWEKVKEQLAQYKCVILVYDKIYTTG